MNKLEPTIVKDISIPVTLEYNDPEGTVTLVAKNEYEFLELDITDIFNEQELQNICNKEILNATITANIVYSKSRVGDGRTEINSYIESVELDIPILKYAKDMLDVDDNEIKDGIECFIYDLLASDEENDPWDNYFWSNRENI